MADGIKIEFSNKERQDEYDQKSKEIAEKYVKIYNEKTKNVGSHTVISILSRNKDEIDIEAKKQIQKIVFNLRHVKRNVQAYRSDDNKIIELSNDIQNSLLKKFPASQKFLMGFYPSQNDLKSLLKKYCALTYDHHLDHLMNKLDLLFSLKKSLEELLLHKFAIESLISEVISLGYPQRLKSLKIEDASFHEIMGEYKSSDFYDIIYKDDEGRGQSSKQEKDEINKEIQKGRGRPLEIPQDEIEHRVRVLISKAKRKDPGYKKFWHHSGRWKGNPNKRQIKLRLIEDDLTGDLDDSTVRRRINRALKVIRQN